MNRRTMITLGVATLALAACAPQNTENDMQDNSDEIAPGTNRDFSFTVATSNPDAVWDLWTRPITWGRWDRGLKSASLEGTMALGSIGQIVPLSGPASQFKVVSFDPEKSYAFETGLPGSVLRVDRFFNADRTQFTHRVSFSGLSAFVFSRMFGQEFRRALPPTMRQLKALSEQH